jgi:clan AA aspartic protease
MAIQEEIGAAILDDTMEPSVGEVRVEVKLTNAADEEMAQRGVLRADQIRIYRADALVDTGSVATVLPVQVAQQLGLRIRGQRVARYADGRREAVDLTEAIIVEIFGRDTVEEAIVLGDEVIIGQTVLEKLDLLVDCNNRRVIPNPAHPDQPVTRV